MMQVCAAFFVQTAHGLHEQTRVCSRQPSPTWYQPPFSVKHLHKCDSCFSLLSQGSHKAEGGQRLPKQVASIVSYGNESCRVQRDYHVICCWQWYLDRRTIFSLWSGRRAERWFRNVSFWRFVEVRSFRCRGAHVCQRKCQWQMNPVIIRVHFPSLGWSLWIAHCL